MIAVLPSLLQQVPGRYCAKNSAEERLHATASGISLENEIKEWYEKGCQNGVKIHTGDFMTVDVFALAFRMISVFWSLKGASKVRL